MQLPAATPGGGNYHSFDSAKLAIAPGGFVKIGDRRDCWQCSITLDFPAIEATAASYQSAIAYGAAP